MPNEAQTCETLVVPKLRAAGWDDAPYSIAEQYRITPGRIVPVGQSFTRKKELRADYVLHYRPDFPLAVVEAKAEGIPVGNAVQQALRYAERLKLRFAYATNGHEMVEVDLFTGLETERSDFPTPEELWDRYRAGTGLADEGVVSRVLAPFHRAPGKSERYYQRIAINRVVEAIVSGRPRVLLTLATGTGKTEVAFQICWKLWNTRWNRTGEHRKPRILYLADRDVLVGQPKSDEFAPLEKALWRVGAGETPSRDIYFATYQVLAGDETRPGRLHEFRPDFFDLVIVDECHRGSARADSVWRGILDYFEPAVKLGMTATPLREETRDTYAYFGEPVYQYSLRQGIEDGFLAPYRVHRVVTDWDADGWRPDPGMLDRYGQPIPDEEYHTPQFERVVALRARTRAIAKHLTRFLEETGRYAKTIVFCVDQEHADAMRRELRNLNAELVLRNQDYVVRVTSADLDVGRMHLDAFKDVEETTPVIVTTSRLLTTGVNIPTCRNVVLARVVGSMVEFKQILGRGTRVREDYGKGWFNLIDYTGSALALFGDQEFDGEPARVTVERMDDDGMATVVEVVDAAPADTPEEADEEPGAEETPRARPDTPSVVRDRTAPPRRKFYVDGGQVEIVADLVYELDADGHQLRNVRLTDYAAEKVRVLCPTADELRERWSDAERREEITAALRERGIDLEQVARAVGHPEADPFDLLCHLAFNAPLRTRRERAQRLRAERRDFFERYGAEARQILDELLEKYAEHGGAQLVLPQILRVPPLSQHGTIAEITAAFGGADRLRQAVTELQTLLYAA